MISLIRRKKPQDKDDDRTGYGLVATEELLFWGGLGTLAFGSGWLAILGGIAVCTSIVLVVFLLVYA